MICFAFVLGLFTAGFRSTSAFAPTSFVHLASNPFRTSGRMSAKRVKKRCAMARECKMGRWDLKTKPSAVQFQIETEAVGSKVAKSMSKKYFQP